MARHFNWLKDHQKVAISGLILTTAGLVVAIAALGRDLTGFEFTHNDQGAATSPATERTLPPSTRPSPTPSDTQTDESTSTPTIQESFPTPSTQSLPAQPSVRYLDELDAEDRNGGYVKGLVTMSNKPYDRSIQFSCNGTNTYFVFPVAGMKSLDFWLGIDDNTAGTYGLVADVTFYGDDGRQIGSRKTAKLGPALKVQVNLDGVTQLKIRCTGRESSSGRPASVPHIAFGDALLAASDQ